ncbi:unnamed protein product [Urochloa humidicola]
MSCGWKLSRQSLHLVMREDLDMYSLRHLDVSNLFHPSTAQALEAEAKAETEKKHDCIGKIVGSIGRLPKPSIYYEPSTPAWYRYSSTTAFALLGDRKNKILCWDGNTTSVYNAESRSLTDRHARAQLGQGAQLRAHLHLHLQRWRRGSQRLPVHDGHGALQVVQLRGAFTLTPWSPTGSGIHSLVRHLWQNRPN